MKMVIWLLTYIIWPLKISSIFIIVAVKLFVLLVHLSSCHRSIIKDQSTIILWEVLVTRSYFKNRGLHIDRDFDGDFFQEFVVLFFSCKQFLKLTQLILSKFPLKEIQVKTFCITQNVFLSSCILFILCLASE